MGSQPSTKSSRTSGREDSGELAPDEWLRLRCLEMATTQQGLFGDAQVEFARKYYAFIKEVGGKNVINAARSFGKSVC